MSPRPPRRVTLALVAVVVAALVVAGVVVGVRLGGGPDSTTDSTTGNTGGSDARSGATSPRPSPSSSAGESPGARTSSAVPEPASPGTVSSSPAVALDERADFGTGVTARITSITSVSGEGRGAGEISGPSLLVGLELSNRGDAPVDVANSTVTLAYGRDDRPATTLYGDERTRPLTGSTPPGGTTSAGYVFAVPTDARGEIAVTVSYAALSPVVAFAGRPG